MAQRMLERKRFLVQRQDVNENALDEVQTKAEVGALRVQQAQMDQRVAALTAERTERLLDLKQIRSPLDGVVIERKMSVGEYVYEQTPVMTIAQIDPLSVELIVPAARYGQIHVGGGARVHPDAPVGGDYPATVEVVDPMIDASSGTFGVRLKLANPDHLIPAGLRCAVQLLPQGGTAATRGAQPRTP
jgi:RND family efflux transporter MFP subunit